MNVTLEPTSVGNFGGLHKNAIAFRKSLEIGDSQEEDITHLEARSAVSPQVLVLEGCHDVS
jgi:hypothetical protein